MWVQVLPEVLAAEARVNAPDAARRKEYERRIKGEPAPLTPAELRKYRSNLHMVRIWLEGGACHHVSFLAGWLCPCWVVEEIWNEWGWVGGAARG